MIINSVESTSKNTDIQNNKLSETQHTFTALESDINGTVERIESINNMIETLDNEIVHIVDAFSNLSAISEQNSAATQETMACIEQMRDAMVKVTEKAQNVDGSADALTNEVNVFKTE